MRHPSLLGLAALLVAMPVLGQPNPPPTEAPPAAPAATTQTNPQPVAETPATAQPPSPVQVRAAVEPDSSSQAPEAPAASSSDRPVSNVLDQPAPLTGPCCLYRRDGVDLAEATTVADLVCTELRERTVPMAKDVADSSAPIYRINVRRLGNSFLVEVLKEQPLGTRHGRESLSLSSMDDAPVAAKRLAEAVRLQTNVEDTAKPGNLTAGETTPMRRRSNYPQFAIGIAGVGTSESADVGAGIDMALVWNTETYGGDLTFRATVGDVQSVGLAVTGRYYLTDGSFAPFVGAGLGIESIGLSSSYQQDNYDGYGEEPRKTGSGLLGRALVGIEGSRLNNSRIGLLANIDVPTFNLRVGRDESYAVGFGLGAYYVF